MKFIVENALLKKVVRLLNFHEGPKKNVYPVSLSARKSESIQGSVSISTLEGVKFVSIHFNAEVSAEGEALFPSKYLPYFDGESDVVRVTKTKRHLEIETHGHYAIPHHRGEVPELPQAEPRGSVTFELSEIKTLFNKVLFASGDDSDQRHNMKCILLDCSTDCIKAVGADRTVVAVSRLSKGSPYKGRFVLPKGGVETIGRLDGDMVTLTFYERAVAFSTCGEIMVDVHMPEFASPFPRYEETMDVNGNTFLYGEKPVLLSSIAAAKKTSADLTLTLKHLNYIKQMPKFFAREMDGGSHYCRRVPLEWTGDDIRIRVNAKTLAQAIEQTTGKVTVAFTYDIGRLSITGEGDDYRAVMVPYSPAEER